MPATLSHSAIRIIHCSKKLHFGSLLLLLCFFIFPSVSAQDVFEVRTGTVHFHSDAPTELISASSTKLAGTIDTRNRTFNFQIGIGSFVGFKCHLMAIRFNKDFMESSTFPTASFTGKIIEDIDLSKNGVYNVRAKGKLLIHGMEQDRIVKAVVTTKNGVITLESDLVIELGDHNIQVPRAFFQTIATEIQVSIRAILASRES